MKSYTRCSIWTLLTLLILLHVSQARRHIKGNVNLKKGGKTSSASVFASCKDEDPLSKDDPMASGNVFGHFDFTYKKKTGRFCAWDCGTKSTKRPDIYCTFGDSDSVLTYRTGIKSNWPQKKDLDWGRITVYPKRWYFAYAVDRCIHDPDITTNQCGGAGTEFVPDQEFGGACNNHDCCYATCDETRKDCDDELYIYARSRCREIYANRQVTGCYQRARLMYEGVRKLGLSAYNTAQKNYCQRRVLQQESGGDTAMLPQRFPEDDGYDFDARESEMKTVAFIGYGASLATTFLLLIGVVAFRRYRHGFDQQHQDDVKSEDGWRTDGSTTSTSTNIS